MPGGSLQPLNVSGFRQLKVLCSIAVKHHAFLPCSSSRKHSLIRRHLQPMRSFTHIRGLVRPSLPAEPFSLSLLFRLECIFDQLCFLRLHQTCSVPLQLVSPALHQISLLSSHLLVLHVYLPPIPFPLPLFLFLFLLPSRQPLLLRPPPHQFHRLPLTLTVLVPLIRIFLTPR